MYKVILSNQEIFFNSLTNMSNSTYDDNQMRQAIAEEFLDDLMVYNMTTEVNFILSCDPYKENNSVPFSEDDIENNNPTSDIVIGRKDYILTKDERDEKLELFEHLRDRAQDTFDRAEERLSTLDGDSYDAYQDRINTFEEDVLNYYIDVCDKLESLEFYNYPYNDVTQWFLCSDFLIRKLKERGEVVLNGEYWGRQCYGQSIVLDYVIQEIAIDWLVEKV